MFLPQPVSEKCYYWSTEGFSTLCSLITQSIFELLETAFSAGGWWCHCLNSDARQHWKDKLVMPFISVYFTVNLIDCSLLTGIAFCAAFCNQACGSGDSTGSGLHWVLSSSSCLSSDSFPSIYSVNVREMLACSLSQCGTGIFSWNESGLFLPNSSQKLGFQELG